MSLEHRSDRTCPQCYLMNVGWEKVVNIFFQKKSHLYICSMPPTSMPVVIGDRNILVGALFSMALKPWSVADCNIPFTYILLKVEYGGGVWGYSGLLLYSSSYLLEHLFHSFFIRQIAFTDMGEGVIQCCLLRSFFK